MEQEELSKKKEKLSLFLKDKHNLIFLAILALGIIIRLYYFYLTKNQPLWWDEADYMAYAKNLAGIDTNWIINAQHNSLLPYIAALFFKLGLSEAVIKFFLEFIPSVIIVYLNDKRIALISTFLMATFWEILFNSFRFHVDNPALMFGFLAIFVFWQGYEKKEKIFGKINPKWAIFIAVFLVILVYSIRRGYFLFGLFFLLYMLLTRKFKDLIKDKYNWFALVFAVILFFITEKFIFLSQISSVAGTYYSAGNISFNLIPFQIFGVYFNDLNNSIFSILVYLFWIGLLIIIYGLILTIGYYKKDDMGKSDSRSDLFLFITILVTISFFLFFTRMSPETGIGDPRWYYPILLGCFVCISKGSLLITSFISKYSKTISIIFLIGIIGFGGYYELQHADMIIKSKIQSYDGIKESSLYVKEISTTGDIITSISNSQVAYYAEREVFDPRINETGTSSMDTKFETFLWQLSKNNNIKYIIITFSEPNYPKWMRNEEYVQNPQTGQVVLSKWMIPFMDTTIDFANNQQDIKQEKTYGDVTFKLLTIKQDAFVYEIIRI
jgi:hypothetical protein